MKLCFMPRGPLKEERTLDLVDYARRVETYPGEVAVEVYEEKWEYESPRRWESDEE